MSTDVFANMIPVTPPMLNSIRNPITQCPNAVPVCDATVTDANHVNTLIPVGIPTTRVAIMK